MIPYMLYPACGRVTPTASAEDDPSQVQGREIGEQDPHRNRFLSKRAKRNTSSGGPAMLFEAAIENGVGVSSLSKNSRPAEDVLLQHIRPDKKEAFDRKPHGCL